MNQGYVFFWRKDEIKICKVGGIRSGGGLNVRVCKDDPCSARIFDGEFRFPVLASDTTCKCDENSTKLNGKIFNYRWRVRGGHLAGF